ncbi:MAG: hypothetical protein JNL87_12900 [Burkholderiaceae bacterium]|nr:hypothetical protein [Burkholderiaceae bacterium]
MNALLGLLFVVAIAAGLRLAARNLRDALRHTASKPRAQGLLLGALLALLSGR